MADVIQLDSARQTVAGAQVASPPFLRVDVHDRSRVEWVATVPVAPAGQTHSWEVHFEADVADAMWVAHQPWDHFQVRSRLTSPALAPGHRMVGPAIDQLRRRALSATHELKLAINGPVRILETARRRDRVLRPDESAEVVNRLYQALDRAATARQACDYLRDARDASLQREQVLVDEFVSSHILLLITRITEAMQGKPTKRHAARPLLGDLAPLSAALHEALQSEQAHRAASGVGAYAIHSGRDVENFMARAAMLKKHFQQALFLDARAYMLDNRLRNWIAAAVAMVASTFYFVWQIYVLNAAMSPGQTTFSLGMACLIAALVYAAKDRIKEVGRDWVARRLKHNYADRVVNLHLQARMDPHQPKLALARETIRVRRRLEPDRLNPELGRTNVVHQISVRERLRHTGLKLLHDQGLVGLKHVFRYDLSPLFDKLDDHIKRVPVATRAGVRTVAATRVYSIPVRVRLTQVGVDKGVQLEQRGVLMVRRQGLIRFARGIEAQELVRQQGFGGNQTPLPMPVASVAPVASASVGPAIVPAIVAAAAITDANPRANVG